MSLRTYLPLQGLFLSFGSHVSMAEKAAIFFTNVVHANAVYKLIYVVNLVGNIEKFRICGAQTSFEIFLGLHYSHYGLNECKADDCKAERAQICPFSFFLCAFLSILKRSGTKVTWKKCNLSVTS